MQEVGMNSSKVIRGCYRWLWLGFLFVMLLGSAADVQSQTDAPPALQKGDIVEILDSVLTAFEVHYVYPDTAKALSQHIREKYASGAYDDITELRTFTRQLNEDIRSFTHDIHISISVMRPDDGPAIGNTITNDQIEKSALTNHGFRKVEWLTGNVGYLRIDRFEYAIYAGEVASAALNFLARCEAVIIDLRYNGGGDETMVRLLGSYFFKNPTMINSLYFTETDSLEQSWTSAYVPGRKLIDTDLYILVSDYTASGAEAFSYGMKHADRATIIGKNTAGAAHWWERWDFPGLQVSAGIPIARPINPVTKTSWERTGVTPHIDAEIDIALTVAHVEALKKIKARTTDEQQRKGLEWDIVGIEVQAEPFSLSLEEMKAYTGQFSDGRYAILLKDKNLYMLYSDGSEYLMVPYTKNLFGFDDTDFYRLEIIRDDDGTIIGARLLIKGREPGEIRPRTGDL
jgi:hypothetical protein